MVEKVFVGDWGLRGGLGTKGRDSRLALVETDPVRILGGLTLSADLGCLIAAV